MDRELYIWDKKRKKLVPYGEHEKEPLHYVIADDMAPLKHPANGRYYTSKSKFRDETRARGLIEIGTENIVDRRPPVDYEAARKRKQAVIDAYQIEKENAWRRKYKRSPVDRTWLDRSPYTDD